MMENADSDTVTKLEVATQQISLHPRKECENPMLNSLVLQTLFKYASRKEIATYRQVCRLWWEESLPRWRSKVRVRLNDDGERGSLTMLSFLDNINATSDPFQFRKHPYRSFDLSYINRKRLRYTGYADMSIRQFEFWRKCGPNMTHLTISHSTFRSVDFEAILFRFLPSLVILKLYFVTWLTDGDKALDWMDVHCETTNNNLEVLEVHQRSRKLLPVSWLRFLSRFPKIKRLDLDQPRSNADEDALWRLNFQRREFEDILSAMVTLAGEQGIAWKLEELELLTMNEPRAVVLESRHSEFFQQLLLPLTFLSLHLGAGSSRTALRSILEACAFTLRKLVVYSDGPDLQDVGEEIMHGFPYGVQLDTLSELWLSGRLLCENLNFLPFTPNLTSLILAQDIGTSLLAAGCKLSLSVFVDSSHIAEMLSYGEIDTDGHLREDNLSILRNTDFSQLEHVAFPNLKTFVVSGRQETTCSADEVAALSKLMPNLTKLMIGLGNDGFRVTCEAWKQLEVLIVQPYKVDQFGLTGNLPLLKHRLPNLSDLTNLRYFGMGFENGGRAKRLLTKESAISAIFPLKNLQDIAAVYNLDKMGVEVRDQLLSKFPSSKIHMAEEDVQEWQFIRDDSDYIDTSGSEVDSSDAEGGVDLDDD